MVSYSSLEDTNYFILHSQDTFYIYDSANPTDLEESISLSWVDDISKLGSATISKFNVACNFYIRSLFFTTSTKEVAVITKDYPSAKYRLSFVSAVGL